MSVVHALLLLTMLTTHTFWCER